MRIRPLEMMDEKTCNDILRPPDFYFSLKPIERVRFWKRELPIRLEKANEIVWKKYPNYKIAEMQDAVSRIDELASRSGNISVQNDLRVVRDILTDLPLLFKNYEEMVALVTIMDYALTDYLNNSEEMLELEGLRREVEELRAENKALKNRLFIVDMVRKKLELLIDEIDFAKAEVDSEESIGLESTFEVIKNAEDVVVRQPSNDKQAYFTTVKKEEGKLDNRQGKNDDDMTVVKHASQLMMGTRKSHDSIMTDKTSSIVLPGRQKKIYEAVKKYGKPMSYSQIAEYMGMKNSPKSKSIPLWVGTLVKKGLLKKVPVKVKNKHGDVKTRYLVALAE